MISCNLYLSSVKVTVCVYVGGCSVAVHGIIVYRSLHVIVTACSSRDLFTVNVC